MAERLRIGELLVETGLISRADLEAALERQKEDKRRLGELLVAAGVIAEAKVTQILSQQLSVPWVSLSHIDFSRALLDLVPSECAQKYGVVPIYVRRGKNKSQTLYVAMQDPTESDALDEIARFSGLPVRAMIAPPTDIKGAIRAYYLGLPPEEEVVAAPPEKPATPPPRPPSSVEVQAAPPAVPAAAPAAVTPPPAPSAGAEAHHDEPPDSSPIESRSERMPRPKKAAQKMVTLTLLDGTQITLPASKGKKRGDSAGPSGLTARDLVEALRAQADGADASEVLGEEVNWERMFAALLSLLLKKHLIHDWEFVRELKR